MNMWRYIFVFVLFISCKKDEPTMTENPLPSAYKGNMSISHNEIKLDVAVEKPAQKEADVLLVFHGTVLYDSLTLAAANNILEKFKELLDRKDMMIISVAYPGEKMLLGDNIAQAEAALLWVKNKAEDALKIKVNKVFLAGHSQGGYLVTRLNTMHATNGVIANAPGPLNLVYRCELEETGKIPSGVFCTRLRMEYGTTSTNPSAYMDRSLLSFADGFKADILFVQGLNDTPIQMNSWPVFKQSIQQCGQCKQVKILEIAGGEHASLFVSPNAKTEFNTFINSR